MRIDGSTPSYSAFSTQKKSAAGGSAFAASLDDFDQPIGEDPSGEEEGGSHDFSHMTPAEMRDLSTDLYDSGDLDLTEILQLQLSGRPFGKIDPDGTLLPLSDAETSAYDGTSQDFIGIANNALDQIESQGRTDDPTSGYQSWQSILSVLNNLQGGARTEDDAV